MSRILLDDARYDQVPTRVATKQVSQSSECLKQPNAFHDSHKCRSIPGCSPLASTIYAEEFSGKPARLYTTGLE
jgi:hypothetical protein